MPHIYIDHSQTDLLMRAISRWSAVVHDNDIWSAADEDCAREALDILGTRLSDLYTLLESKKEDN
jgi:hypothetical protein